MISKAIAGMLAAMLPGAPATGPQVAGTWQCEYGVRDLTGQLPAVYLEYRMQVHPNGSWQGRGMQSGDGGPYPWQGQGRWEIRGGEFSKEGRQHDILGQTIPFLAGYTITGPGHMHDTTRSGNTVLAVQCRRP